MTPSRLGGSPEIQWALFESTVFCRVAGNGLNGTRSEALHYAGNLPCFAVDLIDDDQGGLTVMAKVLDDHLFMPVVCEVGDERALDACFVVLTADHLGVVLLDDVLLDGYDFWREIWFGRVGRECAE